LLHRLTLFLILLLTASLRGAAQQNTNYRNELGFRSDNDAYLLYGQDRYYTNGLFITFRHALRQADSLSVKCILEIEAGQYMYNPRSGVIQNAEQIDRPFAAYLYGGAALGWIGRKENYHKVALEMGTIGPAAKGREAQETLHNALGFYRIAGWEYQVKNETGVNLSFRETNLLGRAGNDADLIADSYVKLGNTFSGLGAGLLFRAGTVNPLQRSTATHSRVSSLSSGTPAPKEFFFFLKPVLNYVLYDATIQGGMFREDKGPVVLKPKRLVFEQQLGFMRSSQRWDVNFQLIFKSRETIGQTFAHRYGTWSFFYRFGKTSGL
jgi:lipid A 3-O-deacylase